MRCPTTMIDSDLHPSPASNIRIILACLPAVVEARTTGVGTDCAAVIPGGAGGVLTTAADEDDDTVDEAGTAGVSLG